jgi:hypothetical protein
MGPNHSGNHLMDRIAERVNRRYATRAPRSGSAVATIFNQLGWQFIGERNDHCRALPHNEASGTLRLRVTGLIPEDEPSLATSTKCSATASPMTSAI